MNNSTDNALPVRKHLSHIPPARVSQYTVGAPYFITICADRNHYDGARLNGGLRTNRPTNAPLIYANNAVRLLLSLDFYRAKGILFPRLALIMPDHLHMVASFPESTDMTKTIQNWKRWTAKDTGIVWQDGFFDYRPRSDTEIAEKLDYIAKNPVRKGLCETVEEWPFRMAWR
jgi:hypothetical protein